MKYVTNSQLIGQLHAVSQAVGCGEPDFPTVHLPFCQQRQVGQRRALTYHRFASCGSPTSTSREFRAYQATYDDCEGN